MSDPGFRGACRILGRGVAFFFLLVNSTNLTGEVDFNGLDANVLRTGRHCEGETDELEN